jgi:nitroimidazol reductase NimA-like FMN-containing flavoprotein (pyridoxamine 5'-phosphate oxidase superfamily)
MLTLVRDEPVEAIASIARAARATSRPFPLDEVECREVLARVGWGVLATVDDGQPYGVPVSYALGRDCVYVGSGPGRKRTQLEGDPRVCLTVCDVGSGERWRSVVVEGAAEPLEGMAARAVALAAFATQRAPQATDLRRLMDARIFRLPLAGMTGRGRGAME